MYRKALLLMVGCGALLLSACACFGPVAVMPESKRDAVVATEVKAQLIKEESIDAAAIRVTSRAGAVTLDGFVDNEAQKRHAESLARETAGVVSLDNRIQVH